jgi:hypothetical protein
MRSQCIASAYLSTVSDVTKVINFRIITDDGWADYTPVNANVVMDSNTLTYFNMTYVWHSEYFFTLTDIPESGTTDDIELHHRIAYCLPPS